MDLAAQPPHRFWLPPGSRLKSDARAFALARLSLHCLFQSQQGQLSLCAHAVPVQTVSEVAYRIREFRLRFYASDTMTQPSQEVRWALLELQVARMCKGVRHAWWTLSGASASSLRPPASVRVADCEGAQA